VGQRWAEEAEEEEAEARDSESKTRTPHKVAGKKNNNFWSRIVKRKWGSQIEKFLTTLYIKRMQFEVHKRVPPTSCQI